MAPFSRYFIDPNIEHIVCVSVLKAIVYNVSDCFSYRVPMETKQLPDNLPCKQFSPCCQYERQWLRHWTLAVTPWEGFDLDATLGAHSTLCGA